MKKGSDGTAFSNLYQIQTIDEREHRPRPLGQTTVLSIRMTKVRFTKESCVTTGFKEFYG